MSEKFLAVKEMLLNDISAALKRNQWIDLQVREKRATLRYGTIHTDGTLEREIATVIYENGQRTKYVHS